ncbi:MAG: MerR family transcriptional regulator [Pseudolabrys sp.]
MFRIGEFSQIARVSGRLLRYYDSLGLLRPARIDPVTGYRYYSASQLPRLNRILALKDLSLSLDQIAKLINDEVSLDDIRAMLMAKKSELELSLREEGARLRNVESRLAQIEEQGALADYDVVVKSAAAQGFLAARSRFADMDAAVAAVRDVAQAVTAQVASAVRDRLVVVAHSDAEDDGLDLEIGITLARHINTRVELPRPLTMSLRELPAADALATVVRGGPNKQSHFAYGALGVWIEANGYRVNGPCREVFLEMPFQSPQQPEPMMEIQFPVTKAS